MRPLFFKVYVVKAIGIPTRVHDVYWFVGLVNYYRDMWRKLSHTLDAITKLCYTKVKFELTDVYQKAFMDMKKIRMGHVNLIP